MSQHPRRGDESSRRATPGRGGPGRPPVTSHAELAEIGMRLFRTRGFHATSIDDIAAAAGVSRRTFFRYFPSKPDLVWGDFEAAVDRLRADLGALPPDLPLMEAITRAVVEFNRIPQDQVTQHRQRMQLILQVPDLVAHSTLRYAIWRRAISDFAAGRLDLPPDHFLPQTIGHCALGASVAAYEQWLQNPTADLSPLLERGFGALSSGFGHHAASAGGARR